jgi:hypothetical protein
MQRRAIHSTRQTFRAQEGNVANKVMEYCQKIHSDYAKLPCIKVGNSVIDEYLPMLVCTVETGKKAQLPLLEQMYVLGETVAKTMQCKIRNSARRMQDAKNEYGRAL